MAALFAIASGCEQEDTSCAQSATCPVDDADGGSDAPRDSGTQGSGDSGGADAALDIDAARLDAFPPDASRDGTPADGPPSDLPRVEGGLEDVLSHDAPSSDGNNDGAVAVDGALADAPADVAPCELDGGRSPTDQPCVVSERFGVFTSPAGSDATGAGTRAAPFRTFARAVQAAKADTHRIYACDDGTGYADGITLDATLDGFELFGGFECATWKLAPTGRTQLRTTSGPALTAKGLVRGVTFERFDFASADATAGASSIAVILENSANVVLRNVRIVAGRGGNGFNGAPGAPGVDGDVAGPEQNGWSADCASPAGDHPGGAWTAASVCGSRGGAGLASNAPWDGQAESGIPMTDVTPPNQTNGGGGFLGIAPAAGSPGDPGGVGAASSVAGQFSAVGYTPSPAAGAGTEGHTGQGGGGGRRGYGNFVPCSIATGGAGGMGGCGGKQGLGGTGGGASVGVLSWSSFALFDQCEVVSAAGGAGGSGGNGGSRGRGMPGGRGGALWAAEGGVYATAGEDGATGGNGGDGGSGAGGNGGPSHALVYAGARPTTRSTSLSPGSPGAPGIGGTVSGVKAPDGAVGPASMELML